MHSLHSVVGLDYRHVPRTHSLHSVVVGLDCHCMPNVLMFTVIIHHRKGHSTRNNWGSQHTEQLKGHKTTEGSQHREQLRVTAHKTTEGSQHTEQLKGHSTQNNWRVTKQLKGHSTRNNWRVTKQLKGHSTQNNRVTHVNKLKINWSWGFCFKMVRWPCTSHRCWVCR